MTTVNRHRRMLGKVRERQQLPASPRIRYTRKSTDEDDRQIASHEQQIAAMNTKWGPTNTGLHFQDSQTGTTFERPGFEEMQEFCRLHTQPQTEHGFIEIYDMSRFGRILTNGEEDPEAVLSMMKTFLKWGWEIRFVTFESTGNPVMDFFQNGLYAIMASEVSKKLKRDTRRGRMHFLTLESGARWLGGSPPLGAMRVDPETRQPLDRFERATSRGGSLLAPNEEELVLWNKAADMLLAGKPYTDIIDYLTAQGARLEWGHRWESKTIKSSLTNYALIGEVRIKHVDPKTEKITEKIYKAGWEPMVDEAKFLAVVQEVQRRNGEGRERNVTFYDVFLPTCAHCGSPYYYQVRNDRGRPPKRLYTHPSPKVPGLNEETRARILKAGCRTWSVDAERVEKGLLDLILERRTSSDFALHLSEVMADRGDLEGAAQKQRHAAETRLRKIEQDQRRTISNMGKAQEMGLDDKLFWQQLSDLNKQIEQARRDKEAALELEAAANAVWTDIQEFIDETRNIKEIWESGDRDRQQEILRWWVRELLIVVDKQEDLPKGHGDPKYMVAFLRTAPTDGLERALTRNADVIDPKTTGDRDRLVNHIIPVAFFAVYEKHVKWAPADTSEVGRTIESYATRVPMTPRQQASVLKLRREK